jgi:hypothetical protein
MEERRRRRYLDPGILQRIGSLELVAREVVKGVRVGMHNKLEKRISRRLK